MTLRTNRGELKAVLDAADAGPGPPPRRVSASQLAPFLNARSMPCVLKGEW